MMVYTLNEDHTECRVVLNLRHAFMAQCRADFHLQASTANIVI